MIIRDITDTTVCYLVWGAIWNIYAIISTIIHPYFDPKKLPWWKWIYYSTATTLAWPYFMYNALRTSYREAQNYKAQRSAKKPGPDVR